MLHLVDAQPLGRGEGRRRGSPPASCARARSPAPRPPGAPPAGVRCSKALRALRPAPATERARATPARRGRRPRASAARPRRAAARARRAGARRSQGRPREPTSRPAGPCAGASANRAGSARERGRTAHPAERPTPRRAARNGSMFDAAPRVRSQPLPVRSPRASTERPARRDRPCLPALVAHRFAAREPREPVPRGGHQPAERRVDLLDRGVLRVERARGGLHAQRMPAQRHGCGSRLSSGRRTVSLRCLHWKRACRPCAAGFACCFR